ncbi:hypothetical protein BHM03_00055357 [Ensete ventricosum]|nr:hypothetical protein BHM03_00055357 [Ensete ventricosum]
MGGRRGSGQAADRKRLSRGERGRAVVVKAGCEWWGSRAGRLLRKEQATTEADVGEAIVATVGAIGSGGCGRSTTTAVVGSRRCRHGWAAGSSETAMQEAEDAAVVVAKKNAVVDAGSQGDAASNRKQRPQMVRWDGSSDKAWCTTAGDNGVVGEVGCDHEGRWWPKERAAIVATRATAIVRAGDEGELLVEEVAMAAWRVQQWLAARASSRDYWL